MGQFSRLMVMCAFLALVFGCAQKSATPLEEQENPTYMRDTQEPVKPASSSEASPEGKKIVSKAQSVIGTPYVLGGSAPGGFDCSGLVKWTYSHIGVTLPRTAREQSVVGEKINNVEDMKAGDIVAFRHPKRGYHTGIYMGDGKFIHSPRKKTRVRINSLSDTYFRDTLLGARRVNLQAGENLVAQAQSRLDEVIAEKTKLSVSSKNMRASNKSRKAPVATASKSSKNSRLAQAKKNQTVKSAKNTKKQEQASKKTAQAAKSKIASKQQAASKNTARGSKTVAENKASKKKAVSTVKKTSGKSREVSMLNKKSQSRPVSRRKHS